MSPEQLGAECLRGTSQAWESLSGSSQASCPALTPTESPAQPESMLWTLLQALRNQGVTSEHQIQKENHSSLEHLRTRSFGDESIGRYVYTNSHGVKPAPYPQPHGSLPRNVR